MDFKKLNERDFNDEEDYLNYSPQTINELQEILKKCDTNNGNTDFDMLQFNLSQQFLLSENLQTSLKIIELIVTGIIEENLTTSHEMKTIAKSVQAEKNKQNETQTNIDISPSTINSMDPEIMEFVLRIFRLWELSQHMFKIRNSFNLPLKVLTTRAFPTDMTEEETAATQAYLKFYNSYYINTSDAKKNDQIGINLRMIPTKSEDQKMYNTVFNSFHQVFDLEFCQNFEKFFGCQSCAGASDKPVLFYLVRQLDKFKKPFCDCLMCIDCANDSVKTEECAICYRTCLYDPEYDAQETKSLIQICPLNFYYKLDFREPSKILKEINDEILKTGEIPYEKENALQEYTKKYLQFNNQTIEIGDSTRITSVQMPASFIAFNLKKNFDETEFIDMLEIFKLYYHVQQKFQELDKNWDQLKPENRNEKIDEFKELLYNEFFEKMLQNRLVSSFEMKEMSNIVIPNDDREPAEQFESNDLKNSNTLIKEIYNQLLKMVENKEKRNANFSFYGLEQFYDNFIITY